MANRGMQFDLRIIHDGEERQVTAGPPTIVAFERKWGMGWGKAMQDVHVDHIAWVAHDALHKAALMGNGTAVKPLTTGLTIWKKSKSWTRIQPLWVGLNNSQHSGVSC